MGPFVVLCGYLLPSSSFASVGAVLSHHHHDNSSSFLTREASVLPAYRCLSHHGGITTTLENITPSPPYLAVPLWLRKGVRPALCEGPSRHMREYYLRCLVGSLLADRLREAVTDDERGEKLPRSGFDGESRGAKHDHATLIFGRCYDGYSGRCCNVRV